MTGAVGLLTVRDVVLAVSSEVKFVSEFAVCHSASFTLIAMVFAPVGRPLLVTIPLKLKILVTPSGSQDVLLGVVRNPPPTAVRSRVTLESPPERLLHPL